MVIQSRGHCIAGDNLGSHSIAGFTENFSCSQYFYRYCEITQSEFQSDPNVCGPQLNPGNCDSAVGDLKMETCSHHQRNQGQLCFQCFEIFMYASLVSHLV